MTATHFVVSGKTRFMQLNPARGRKPFFLDAITVRYH